MSQQFDKLTNHFVRRQGNTLQYAVVERSSTKNLLISFKLNISWFGWRVTFIVPKRACNHQIRAVSVACDGDIMHAALTQ